MPIARSVLEPCKNPHCCKPNAHPGTCLARLPTSLDEIVRDWEQAGPYLRHKLASNVMVSPLLGLMDVVNLAKNVKS